jgi:hypothetical protein
MTKTLQPCGCGEGGQPQIMVSWRTRRIGGIHHFADASPAECIPPTGGPAVISRNRLANGSEIETAEAGRATRPLD